MKVAETILPHKPNKTQTSFIFIKNINRDAKPFIEKNDSSKNNNLISTEYKVLKNQNNVPSTVNEKENSFINKKYKDFNFEEEHNSNFKDSKQAVFKSNDKKLNILQEPIKIDSIASNQSIAKSSPKTITSKLPASKNLKVEAIEKTNTNPLQDEGFLNALGHVEKTRHAKEKHEPANLKIKQVTNASELPVAKQQIQNNQLAHVETISAAASEKKEPITADSFKIKFNAKLKNLEDNIPTNEEGAKKFKKDEPIKKLNNNIKGELEANKQNLVGPLESETKTKEAPKSNLPTKKVVNLPTKINSPSAKPINAKEATPKEKTDQEISLEEGSKELDDKLKLNNISSKTLQNSEEPDFLVGVSEKENAQQKASEFPLAYRQKEEATLLESKGIMSNLATAGLGQMDKAKTNAVNSVINKQTSTKEKSVKSKDDIVGELRDKYTETKEKVEGILTTLSESVEKEFTSVIEKANKVFEDNVNVKLGSVYGWLGWKKAFKSEKKINAQVEAVFISEKEIFVKALDTGITSISTTIATQLNIALNTITEGKRSIQTYFNGLSESEKKLGQEAFDDFQAQFTDLENSVYDQQNDLADGLVASYNASVVALHETFETLNEEAGKSLLDMAMDTINGIIDTIKKLKEIVNNLLSAIAVVIDVIMADPIGFMTDLFEGIALGFENFKTNIKQHLIVGLIEWLTGSLGPLGITIPENIFSLSGIFNLLMQVLGLGWATIRLKAVKLLGEPAVTVLEKAFEIFTLFKEKGLKGIWEYLKEKFNDLKETVIGAIEDLIKTKVIEAGIKWLLSLLIPGAGFIKAIMAIKDIIVFFVESAIVLIPAIIEAILGLAKGSIAMVAKAIEFGLAKIIPVVISLLANLLGLKGLAKGILKIFEKIRKKVDRQINKILLKAEAKFKKLFDKKKEKKKGEKDEKNKKLDDTEVGEEVKFKGGGENHKIYFKKKGKKQELIMESEAEPMMDKLKDWESAAKNHEKKEELKKLINKVKGATKDSETQATKVNELFFKANKDIKLGEKAVKEDNELEGKEDILKNNIMKLLGILGVTKSPLMKFVDKKIDVATIENGAKKVTAEFRDVVDKQGDYKVDKDGIVSRVAGKKKELQKLSINSEGKLVIGSDKGEKHKKWLPRKMTLSESSKGGYEMRFVTDSFEKKEQKFTVGIKYGQLDDSTKSNSETRTVELEGGHLASNKRGYNDSAKAGFENAHLIADRFGGTGHNQGFNILPSSKNYNQNVMKPKEFDLEQDLKKSIIDSKGFKMTTIAILKDYYGSHNKIEKKDLEELFKKELVNDNKSVSKKTIENIEEKELLSKIRAAVSHDIKKAPSQFLETRYTIEDTISTKGSKKLEGKIGKDEQYGVAIEELFPNN